MTAYRTDQHAPTEPGTGRRTFLAAGLGVAAATALGACGSSGSTEEKTTSSGGGFPVTLAGKEGSVTVRSAPRRVVAAGYLRDTDLALALGAPLVGAARNAVFPHGTAPWQHLDAGTTLFATTDGMPFEKIAALRPDLILASDDYTLAQDHAKLAALAPTLSYATGVGADTWQEMTTRAGKVLGRAARAAALVRSTESAVAGAKRQHPVLTGKTFTFGPVSDPSTIYTINDAADASARFFSQLGMRLSPKVTALPDSSTPRRAELSPERLDLLDADVLVLSFPQESTRKVLETLPAFQRLAAVRRGSYVALDLAPAVALGFPSVLSIPYALRVTVPKLVAAASRA